MTVRENAKFYFLCVTCFDLHAHTRTRTQTNRASLVNNPKVLHEVKLHGSAKLSAGQGVVQIPNVSQEVDLMTNTPASFETVFSFQFNNDTSVVQDSDANLVAAG